MYTRPQKLAETIALQQRLLREAMVEQANILRTSPSAGGVRYCGDREGGAAVEFHDKKTQEACEWKVCFHFKKFVHTLIF